ncbi:hypothetical protein K503DRAFT_797382 [Rhizopogon vinicolor AM-OR11-026]|uniref:Protein kinase domain-containing protein n=1 Tax=Rhizopogon vinicolor AM-OR11-026 TaxID=1314800 RepID=A0A1B7NBM4_9AGAM|nr:hypothetical protein K503DRAFT_797382 [Rhizopogon vinicolor AM-OR11-026]
MPLNASMCPVSSSHSMLRSALTKSSKPPKKEYLHIVVQGPPTGPVATVIPFLKQRAAYLKKRTGTPLEWARPAQFATLQFYEEEYLCNRPRDAADPVPATLLELIFAQFMDDCREYQPTAEDSQFIRKLSEEMCKYYGGSDERMHVFSQLFQYLNIELTSDTIGSSKCGTDGHSLSTCGKFAVVVLVGNNEIGSGGGDPFAQAMLHYRTIREDSWAEIINLESIVPSFLIIVFDACIAITGSVFIEKIQCDVLAPVIPLFWHLRDIPMQETTVRTLGALKQAVKKLQDVYSKPIPRFRDENLISTLGCPYPRSYHDSTNVRHDFSYDGDDNQTLRDRLIFFGETNDAARKKLCIKFVRHYSREAHDFCAEKGHAPKLIAYNHLSAGWIMVVMDVLDIDNGVFSQRPGAYRQLAKMNVSACQPLEEPVRSLIRQLHEYGYVHGDLRDINFFTRDDKKHFMLLDFDWAGPIGSTRYLMHVNWQQVKCPEGARDWEVISKAHDLEMLSYMFPRKQDGREASTQGGSATKRCHISSTTSNGEELMDTG